MSDAVVQLPIEDVILDPRLQMRVTMDFDVIDDYAEHVDQLPPCRAFIVDGRTLLTSGWHRFHAHKKAKKELLPCLISQGTFPEAILDAAGQNHGHGIRRTNDDKRRAVTALIQTKEYGDKSNRMIANACHVSDQLVADVREKMTAPKHNSQVRENAPDQSEPKNGLCVRCARIGVASCPECKGKSSPAPTRQPSRPRVRRTGSDGKSYPVQAPQPKPEPKDRRSKPITDTRCLNLIKTCEAALSEEDADEALQLALDAAKAARELCLDLTHHPTLDEVKAYCEERKNSVNPETWFAHYKSNGWMVGKNRMRDWRAAVVTWEGNEKKWTKERSDGKATGRVSSPQSSIDAWERKAARTRA